MKAIKIIALILLIAVPSWSFGWSGRAGVRPGFHRGGLVFGFAGRAAPRFFGNSFLFSRAFYPGPYSYYPGLYPYYAPGYVSYPYIYQPYSYPTAYDISPPPPAATPEGAYNRGYSEGYSQGYEQGQKEHEKELYEEGKKRGYEEGYNASKESQ